MVNFLVMAAEEVRTNTAQLGFASVQEMGGQSQCMEIRPAAATINPMLGMIDLLIMLEPSHQIVDDARVGRATWSTLPPKTTPWTRRLT